MNPSGGPDDRPLHNERRRCGDVLLRGNARWHGQDSRQFLVTATVDYGYAP